MQLVSSIWRVFGLAVLQRARAASKCVLLQVGQRFTILTSYYDVKMSSTRWSSCPSIQHLSTCRGTDSSGHLDRRMNCVEDLIRSTAQLVSDSRAY